MKIQLMLDVQKLAAKIKDKCNWILNTNDEKIIAKSASDIEAMAFEMFYLIRESEKKENG